LKNIKIYTLTKINKKLIIKFFVTKTGKILRGSSH